MPPPDPVREYLRLCDATAGQIGRSKDWRKTHHYAITLWLSLTPEQQGIIIDIFDHQENNRANP